MRVLSRLQRVNRILVISFTTAIVGAVAASAVTPNYSLIQKIFLANGVVESDGVLHFDLVRGDLKITVGGQAVNSALAGNGYVNFKYLGNDTWFTDGSLPATEAEVPGVEAALRAQQNINVTAVVNQIASETPRLLWVHFEGQGADGPLATQINVALERIANAQRGVTSVPVPLSVIPGATFQSAFIEANGTAVQLNNSVFVFTVPRDDIAFFSLGSVPASASLGAYYNFYVEPLSTGNNIVLYTDLALKTSELQLFRDALATSGLDVSAVHGNYIDDNQRLFNVNGFAIGDAGTLGNALYNNLTNILNNVD